MIMKKTRPNNSFLDSGKLTALFDYVKNLVIFSLLLALGTNDLHHHQSNFFGVLSSKYLGIGVIAVALILVFLNLYDGIRRLTRLEHHKFFTAILILLCIFITIRIVEVAWYYRL